ncbi:MAG TPA: hypothetical protein VMT53_16650 [Terriglobales bacterium]|nr:hypothetical protein [Terriglobales bacterium]
MKTGVPSRFLIIILLFLSAAAWAVAVAQEPSAQPPSAQTPGQEPASQQPLSTYKPKFPGDPARSDDEALALAYMRVVVRAQNLYKKRHDHYAPTLADLAGTGSFTKRMARTTDRGNYTAEFHSKNKGESYTIAMVPKQYDPQHRAFFADEDAVMHAEEGKPATQESPKIK